MNEYELDVFDERIRESVERAQRRGGRLERAVRPFALVVLALTVAELGAEVVGATSSSALRGGDQWLRLAAAVVPIVGLVWLARRPGACIAACVTVLVALGLGAVAEHGVVVGGGAAVLLLAGLYVGAQLEASWTVRRIARQIEDERQP